MSRGALLFGRGIYEWKSISDSDSLIRARDASSAVYIEGSQIFPDLPRYERATLVQPGGAKEIIYGSQDAE